MEQGCVCKDIIAVKDQICRGTSGENPTLQCENDAVVRSDKCQCGTFQAEEEEYCYTDGRIIKKCAQLDNVCEVINEHCVVSGEGCVCDGILAVPQQTCKASPSLN